MHERPCATVLLAVALAVTWPRAAAAEAPAPTASESAPEARSDGGQTQWTHPEDAAPSLPSGPVKARPTPPSDARGPSAYAGLRALSLRDGEALLQTADGQQRLLRPGDPLGADVVKAVDEGLIVLARPEQPGRPGGEATVVMRFDAQGKPSVRVYYAEDSTPAEPPRTH